MSSSSSLSFFSCLIFFFFRPKMLPEKLDATYPLQLGVLVGALLLEVLDLRREAAACCRSVKFQQNVTRFRLYRHRFLQENTRLDSLVLEILLSPQRRGRKIEGGCKVEGAKQRGGAKLIPQRRGGVQR